MKLKGQRQSDNIEDIRPSPPGKRSPKTNRAYTDAMVAEKTKKWIEAPIDPGYADLQKYTGGPEDVLYNDYGKTSRVKAGASNPPSQKNTPEFKAKRK